MTLQPGMFVRHTGQPSWGTGVVVDLIPPDKVHLRFALAGEKTLKTSLAPLEAATPTPSEERYLAGPAMRPHKAMADRRSHESLVEEFLRKFPGGFKAPEYLREERDYKLEARSLALDLLSEERMRAKLESGQADEVTHDALRIVDKTNLIFPNEKMDLKDGLATGPARENFASVLFDLLHGAGPFQERFEAFADVLHAIGAAKWTTATYFPFLMYPSEHMFLKPIVTQRAADACGFDLAYRPDLNYRTYERLLLLAGNLKESLAPLEPRDMIDVQSFLWVAGGASDASD